MSFKQYLRSITLTRALPDGHLPSDTEFWEVKSHPLLPTLKNPERMHIFLKAYMHTRLKASTFKKGKCEDIH